MIKVITSICVLFLISCNTSTSNKSNPLNNDLITEQKSKGVSVSTYIIKEQTFHKQIIANGKIEALQKSELRFKTSEYIASIKVKNGQKINKGQLIATLDNEAFKNQIDKTRLEIEKATTKLQEEKINYGLSIDNEVNIDTNILRNLQVKSGYLEAKNTLKNAQFEYNQTFLKAPFSGIVANIETKPSNYITSSDVFCTLINPNQLIVLFSVLESDLPFFKKNQSVDITTFINSDKTYKGVITEINPIIDKNGLIKIKAKINKPDMNLLDGMNVKILANQLLNNVLVVPKEALILRSNKEVIFTLESGLAKWNYVKVLDENSNSYAIKDGLNVGDTIIVSGNTNLSHDAKVNASFIYDKDNK